MRQLRHLRCAEMPTDSHIDEEDKRKSWITMVKATQSEDETPLLEASTAVTGSTLSSAIAEDARGTASETAEGHIIDDRATSEIQQYSAFASNSSTPDTPNVRWSKLQPHPSSLEWEPAATPVTHASSFSNFTLRGPPKETNLVNIDLDPISGRKLINHYEIITELERSKRSKVKLGINLATDTYVAIKIVPRFPRWGNPPNMNTVQDWATKEVAILKEIAILQQVQHPNLIALLEVIDDPNRKKVYIIFEWAELGQIQWRVKGPEEIAMIEIRRYEMEKSGRSNRQLDMEDAAVILEAQKRLSKRGKEDFRKFQQIRPDGSPVIRSVEAADGESYAPNENKPSRVSIGLPRNDIPHSDSRRSSASSSPLRLVAADAAELTPRDLSSTTEAPTHSPFTLKDVYTNSERNLYENHTYEELSGVPSSPLSEPFRQNAISSSEDLSGMASEILDSSVLEELLYVPVLTIQQTRVAFRDTLLGLQWLHCQGIVHCNINPSNLLGTREHRWKLSGVGHSYLRRRTEEDETLEDVFEAEAQILDREAERLKMAFGTPAFYAPELCMLEPADNAPPITSAIDIWSLGVTLFCMVFARTPFVGCEFDTIRQIAEEDVHIPKKRLKPVEDEISPRSPLQRLVDPPLTYERRHNLGLEYENIDDGLWDLLKRMLVKDPRKRITLEEIRFHPWLTADIDNKVKWLEETRPPRKSRSTLSRVTQKDANPAVAPSFLDRSREPVSDEETSDHVLSIASIESYQESVFTPGGSQSSVSSADLQSPGAIDIFVDFFLKDKELSSLYKESFEKITVGKFIRNQQRLLKGFYLDLHSQEPDVTQRKAIRFLQGRKNRETVIRKIYGSLSSANDFEELRARAQSRANVDLVARMLQSTLYSNRDGTTAGSSVRSGDIGASTITRNIDVEPSPEEQADTSDSDTSKRSSDDEIEAKGMLNHKMILKMTKNFLFGGVAFQLYKEKVRGSVWPNSSPSLQQVIDKGNVEDVQRLLENDFENVTRAEFVWLRDLLEAGFGYRELAELLVDVKTDTPWLYFEPCTGSRYQLYAGFHQETCIHRVTDHLYQGRTFESRSSEWIHQDTRLQFNEENHIKRYLSELCGLAGVVPSSRLLSDWDGQVDFEQDRDYRTARVSYQLEGSDLYTTVSLAVRIRRVGDRLRNAFGLLQNSGICCNSFTILRWSSHDSTDRSVEIHRIEAQQVLILLALLDSLEDNGTQQLQQLATCASSIVRQATDLELAQQLSSDIGNADGHQQVLHLVALAVQILCLGLLSYSRAHIGSLHPFFLVNPLHRIILQGSCKRYHQHLQVIAELVELTCLGDLTQGPVLVFGSTSASMDNGEKERYNVLASLEDVVDTWGPGVLITDPVNMQGAKVFGVEIRGGILAPTDASASSLHWKKVDWESGFEFSCLSTQRCDLRYKTLIGMIRENDACPLRRQENEADVRQLCSGSLHVLGTAPPHWYHKTTQVGLQGGQYAIVTVGAGFEKREGVTVKDRILQGLDSTRPRLSLQDLEAYYGLQISLCTGVARRIPLRSLLADVLIAYVESNIPKPFGWKEFKDELLDALRGPNLESWLQGLQSEDIQLSVVFTLGNLLKHLRHTGLDSEGKLIVAWIRPGEDRLCFKLHCDNRNFWAKILEDTDNCATFACITTVCLEKDDLRCRSPAVDGWRDVSELLATEICHHVAGSSGAIVRTHEQFVLQDKFSYWIGPEKSGLLASAKLEGLPSAQPRLEISRKWMGRVPEKYHDMLLLKQKVARARIRERGAIAGQTILVAVCARSV